MNQHDRIMVMSGMTLGMAVVGVLYAHLWWQLILFPLLAAHAVYGIVKTQRHFAEYKDMVAVRFANLQSQDGRA